MNTKIGNSTLGEMLPYFIVIIILLLIVVFCFRMVIVTSRAKNERKKQTAILQNQGLTIYAAFLHVNGLPIAENILCDVFSYPDRLEFKSGSTEFKLMRNKITDICIKTDTEIQKQMVSSVGGAIAGGIMFGPLGAIIGGRTKTKKSKSTSSYLIITYLNSQEEITYIGFDIGNNFSSATKLVKEFRELNTNTKVQIEL